MILKSLLSLGYFPRELPSAFTTADFGTHADEIIAAWEKAKIFERQPVKKKNNSYTYKIWDTELETISKPKRGYERRSVHITHPIPQAVLCLEIANNWKSISKWLSKQQHSLDKIDISSKYARAIKGIDFRSHETKKDYIESTSDWLVRTDITRFYPSIYTHSVPWAAYGKAQVKSDLKKYQGSLADRIDALVRSCNRNQTIGIPIGPETSRIIAEVVSSEIDTVIRNRLDHLDVKKFDRLQDDWFVGADSLDDAESILSQIVLSYREFGLEINGTKTSVQHILARDKKTWRAELSSHVISAHGYLSGSRLHDFLKLVLRLQAVNMNDPVVSYGITVIEGKKFTETDVAFVESFLLEASVLSPIAIDRICHLMVNINEGKNSISTSRVRDRFKSLCERNLQNGNDYEAIWMMYTLRGLKTPFQSKSIADQMEFHIGSSIPIVLLDMKNKGLFKSVLPIANWEKQLDGDRIRKDWIWLLAYEGIRNGWLKDKKSIMSKSFFEPMITRNVQFYDPSKNVPKIAAAHRKRMNAIKSSIKSSKDLLAELRGKMITKLILQDVEDY